MGESGAIFGAVSEIMLDLGVRCTVLLLQGFFLNIFIFYFSVAFGAKASVFYL